VEIEEICSKLRPILGKKIDKLYLAYQLEPNMRDEIRGLLFALAEKYLQETYQRKEILLEPPPEDIARGKYKLGKICYNHNELYPFGLRESELHQHCGIFGRSGAGKTNVCFLLLSGLAKSNKPFLIFDWKRTYRNLLNLPEFENMLIFRAGDSISPFFFNPFIPPQDVKGEKYLSYVRNIISLVCNTYFGDGRLLSVQGVEYLLLKAIESLLQKDSPIIFRDLYQWITNYKGLTREKDWKSSVLNVLYKISTGPIGKVFNTHNPIPIEKLLKEKVLLEMDTFGNEKDKAFLVKLLLLWIYNQRLSEDDKKKFKHAIVIEEAHHLFMRKNQEVSGEESFLDFIMRQIRELGEGIILIDQHPSLISIPALGNTYCTIGMNLKHEQDVKAISEAMLLKPEQREYLGKLEVGSGIVKLQGRWFQPFLVRFPEMELRKNIDNKFIQKKMMGYFKKLGVSCSEQQPIKTFQDYQSEEKAESFSSEEVKILLDILKNPFSPITERYHRLGFTPYRGNKFRDSLINKGMINMHSISTGTGRIKLLNLIFPKELPEGNGL